MELFVLGTSRDVGLTRTWGSAASSLTQWSLVWEFQEQRPGNTTSLFCGQGCNILRKRQSAIQLVLAPFPNSVPVTSLHLNICSVRLPALKDSCKIKFPNSIIYWPHWPWWQHRTAVPNFSTTIILEKGDISIFPHQNRNLEHNTRYSCSASATARLSLKILFLDSRRLCNTRTRCRG